MIRPPQIKRTFAILLLGISPWLWSGCCSINKQAAQKLAEHGAATSAEIANSYSVTKQQLVTYVEGEYLLSGLKDGYSKPSKEMLDSIRRVQTELALRKQMLDDLSTLYQAFAALCTYDAVGETEKAASELAAAGKSYADTVFSGTIIPDAAGQLFAKGTGQIAGQAQLCRIRDASRHIRANLDGIVFLLQKQKEQEALTAIREEISRNRLKVATSLWNENLGLADNILDGQVSSYGLSLNRDAAKAAATNPRLKNAIGQVLASRHNSEMEAAGDAYAAAVQALKKLTEEHKKLEKGESVSLASLRTDLATIQEYVDLVTKLRKEHN